MPLPRGETPEKRAARLAAEAFQAGKIGPVEYIDAQPPGTKLNHEGKVYLSSMDGPQLLQHIPIAGIMGRHLQVYRNKDQVARYRAEIDKARATGQDLMTAIEPVTAGKHTDGIDGHYYLQDGHHRVDAAEAEGLSHVPAWMPAKDEAVPMGKIPEDTMKLSRIKEKIRKAKRGDAAEPVRLKPEATEFNYGANEKPTVPSISQAGVAAPNNTPPSGSPTGRIPVGLRSEDYETWAPQHMLPHEAAIYARGKRRAALKGNLEPMEGLLQATISGRHGRHWYDENHDITNAMNVHSSDSDDKFRDFAIEAAYSANNAIVPNHKAALDAKRLFQGGGVVNGQHIEARTKDPAKLKTLLTAYQKGDAIFYPPDYKDEDLRGQLMVKRDVDPKSGDVKKMIHTNDGWEIIPLIYPIHTGLAVKALSNISEFSNPHKHFLFTLNPEKVNSFLMNKLGNQHATTIDRHEGRGWGVPEWKGRQKLDLLHGDLYHVLAAGGRHITSLLKRPEFNPHHDHPIYGLGWTSARGQAARWMTYRGIADAIRKGATPEQAVANLKAKDIYETSSFVRMYQHPELRSRLRTMIREGHVSPTFFNDLLHIERRYEPARHELDMPVGHPDLLPVAKRIHAAVSAEAKAAKRRETAKLKVTKKRLGQLIKKAMTTSFSSPNMEQLDFGQALNRLKSENHQRFRQAAAGLIQRLGIAGDLHDAIGDWQDGAENSLVHHLEVPDPKVSRYIAAWMGRLGRQKGVIHFTPDPEGTHRMYQTDLGETNLGYLREQLSFHDIPFRTLVPHGRGTTVILYDEDGSKRDNFHAFARSHNGQVSELTGTGEFIGGDDRAAAAAKYREVIDEFERGGSHAQGGGTGTPSDNPPGPAGRRQAPEGGVVHRGQFYRGGTALPSEG